MIPLSLLRVFTEEEFYLLLNGQPQIDVGRLQTSMLAGMGVLTNPWLVRCSFRLLLFLLLFLSHPFSATLPVAVPLRLSPSCLIAEFLFELSSSSSRSRIFSTVVCFFSLSGTGKEESSRHEREEALRLVRGLAGEGAVLVGCRERALMPLCSLSLGLGRVLDAVWELSASVQSVAACRGQKDNAHASAWLEVSSHRCSGVDWPVRFCKPQDLSSREERGSAFYAAIAIPVYLLLSVCLYVYVGETYVGWGGGGGGRSGALFLSGRNVWA